MTEGVPADSFGDAQLYCCRPDEAPHKSLPPEGQPTLSRRTGEDPIRWLTEARTATPCTKSPNQMAVEGYRLLRCFGLTRTNGLFNDRSQDAGLLSGEINVPPL